MKEMRTGLNEMQPTTIADAAVVNATPALSPRASLEDAAPDTRFALFDPRTDDFQKYNFRS